MPTAAFFFNLPVFTVAGLNDSFLHILTGRKKTLCRRLQLEIEQVFFTLHPMAECQDLKQLKY